MQGKLKNHLRWAFLLAAPLWLAGCSVMDKKDCQGANWYDLGRRDALNGKYQPSSRAQACAEHGLGMDKEAYERGVQEGLLGFCTAASGRAYGENGGSYSRGFCPVQAEAAFLAGYNPAYQKYQFRQRINELQRQIDSNNESLDRELKKKDRNDREIERLRNEVRRLQSKIQLEMSMRILE